MRGSYYSGGRTNRGGRSNRGSTVYPNIKQFHRNEVYSDLSALLILLDVEDINSKVESV